MQRLKIHIDPCHRKMAERNQDKPLRFSCMWEGRKQSDEAAGEAQRPTELDIVPSPTLD